MMMTLPSVCLIDKFDLRTSSSSHVLWICVRLVTATEKVGGGGGECIELSVWLANSGLR